MKSPKLIYASTMRFRLEFGNYEGLMPQQQIETDLASEEWRTEVDFQQCWSRSRHNGCGGGRRDPKNERRPETRDETMAIFACKWPSHRTPTFRTVRESTHPTAIACHTLQPQLGSTTFCSFDRTFIHPSIDPSIDPSIFWVRIETWWTRNLTGRKVHPGHEIAPCGRAWAAVGANFVVQCRPDFSRNRTDVFNTEVDHPLYLVLQVPSCKDHQARGCQVVLVCFY